MNGQFTVIQNKIFLDKRLTTIDFSILAALQSMMGVNGYCFPSYNHLASMAHCSRRSAINSIQKLEKLNYVIKLKGTITGTEEQTSNRYYINNNPDAGEKPFAERQKNSAADAPRTAEIGVQNLHHPLVQDLHPEQDKFFEKNARACARTREDENCTPNDETESGLMPEAKPDNSSNMYCPDFPLSEEVRLCADVNAEWKKAFNKSLWIFGDFVKTQQKQGLFFRVNHIHEKDFDFEALKGIFSGYTNNPLFLLKPDNHFTDEKKVEYDS